MPKFRVAEALPKPVPQIDVFLQEEMSGSVAIMVSSPSVVPFAVAWLTDDGMLVRNVCRRDDLQSLGFEVDNDGCIKEPA